VQDFLLPILKRRQRKLYQKIIDEHNELFETRRTVREVRRFIEVIGRIRKALSDDLTATDRTQLNSILSSYPPLEELRKWQETAIRQHEEQQRLYARVARDYKTATKKIRRQEAFFDEIKQRIAGNAEHIPPDTQVIAKTKGDDRIDIYWDGTNGQPSGPGHGHYIFTEKGLVFRRDPITSS
jgi:hypothetical protein